MSEQILSEKYLLTNEMLCDSFSQNKHMNFYEAENKITGEYYEILSINYKENTGLRAAAKREIDHSIKPLIDSKNNGIQKIIEVNEDEKEQCFYIVYETIDKEEEQSKFAKQDFEQCINILDQLKKENRQGFILNQYTVVNKQKTQIKIRFIGLFYLFQRLNVNFNEDIKDKRRIQDDIKSLANLFSDYLQESEGKEIYQKCIDDKYKKYSELMQDIKNIPDEPNPDYRYIEVAIDDRKYDFEKVLAQLNSGCYWVIRNELSKKEEVEIKWSSSEQSGKAYVVSEGNEGNEAYGYLFISYVKDSPDETVLKDGEKAKYNFERHEYKYYSIDYFFKKYNEVNKLAQLNTTKTDTIETWKTLPEKEKEYIEEQAFKANYLNREKSKNNPLNIIFTLEDKFKEWNVIKDKKNEEIILSINGKSIGKILDYKQHENKIIIKDPRIDIDRISKTGALVEDVQQQTSQYKKQVEACEKLEQKDIANPVLAGFIATPEKLSQHNINIDYESFEEKIINKNIRSDETQKNAVIEALCKKPIYLIQGPPGTGKTTVIVEIVEQLIRQKKDIKILVVSQSNMAVDNVLERLPEDILFMRLASDLATEKGNITPAIKAHLFDEKLKKWIQKTKENSKKYLENKFPECDRFLLQLHTKFKTQSPKDINAFKKLYRKEIASNYHEKLFNKAKNTNDVKEIFDKELGKEYLKLSKIQKNWHAFINNATSIDNEKYGTYTLDAPVFLFGFFNPFPPAG